MASKRSPGTEACSSTAETSQILICEGDLSCTVHSIISKNTAGCEDYLTRGTGLINIDDEQDPCARYDGT